MSVNENTLSAQRRILDRLIEWEELVGQLYTRYAQQFPAQSTTWRQLAREEKTHAGALGAIRKLLDAGHLLENIGQFDIDLIENEVNVVHHALKRAKADDLDLREAISTAHQLENSVIESQFYDAVSCRAPEFERIAKRLRDDTTRHIEKLRALGS